MNLTNLILYYIVMTYYLNSTIFSIFFDIYTILPSILYNIIFFNINTYIDNLNIFFFNINTYIDNLNIFFFNIDVLYYNLLDWLEQWVGSDLDPSYPSRMREGFPLEHGNMKCYLVTLPTMDVDIGERTIVIPPNPNNKWILEDIQVKLGSLTIVLPETTLIVEEFSKKEYLTIYEIHPITIVVNEIIISIPGYEDIIATPEEFKVIVSLQPDMDVKVNDVPYKFQFIITLSDIEMVIPEFKVFLSEHILTEVIIPEITGTIPSFEISASKLIGQDMIPLKDPRK